MKKTVLCIGLVAILLISTGCTSKIKDISYKDLNNSIANKETFILEIMQDECPYCEEFSPRFNKIVSKYKLENVYKLNLSKLSEKEFNKLSETMSLNSTPVVTFFKDGKERSNMHKIEGAVDDTVVISKLKSLNYIK